MTFQGKIQRTKISLYRAKGFSDREIAEKLDLDPSTISYHREQIREMDKDNSDLIDELQTMLERNLSI